MSRLSALIIPTLLCALLLAACGGSSEPTAGSTAPLTTASTSTAQTRIAQLQTCKAALEAYTALARAFDNVASDGSDTSADGQGVADAATLKTSLAQLRDQATTSQLPQIDQYTEVLSQVQTALKSAASGDLQPATGQLAGVAQQIGQIPSLINEICKL